MIRDAMRGPKRIGPIGPTIPGDDVEVSRELARIRFDMGRIKRATTKINRVFGEGMSSGFYGDGSDGVVVLTGDTTLTKDMFYESLDLDGFNLETGGFRVFVQERLVIPSASRIHRDGTTATGRLGGAAKGTGSILAGAPAGAAGGTSPAIGANSAAASDALGGRGGNGGAGVGPHAGGTSGVATLPTAIRGRPYAIPQAMSFMGANAFTTFHSGTGGAGGGGGNAGAGTTKDGGGGGGCAGVVIVAARQIILDGKITANGGNGGPANGAAGSGGGGGGGGGGGIVVCMYSVIDGEAVMEVKGGAGGVGDVAGGGVSGAVGLDGIIVELPGA